MLHCILLLYLIVSPFGVSCFIVIGVNCLFSPFIVSLMLVFPISLWFRFIVFFSFFFWFVIHCKVYCVSYFIMFEFIFYLSMFVYTFLFIFDHILSPLFLYYIRFVHFSTNTPILNLSLLLFFALELFCLMLRYLKIKVIFFHHL